MNCIRIQFPRIRELLFKQRTNFRIVFPFTHDSHYANTSHRTEAFLP